MTRWTTTGILAVCSMHVTNGLLLSVMAARNWRWLCQRRQTLLATSVEQEHSVAILLPAYQEAGTIESCLWSINNLERRGVANLVVYVIGTAREQGDRHARGHTFAAVEAVVHTPEFGVDVQYVHYPFQHGG